MKCKVFIGTPKSVGNDVNKWLDEIQATNEIRIDSVTQSFEETQGNMILTIFYKLFTKFN